MTEKEKEKEQATLEQDPNGSNDKGTAPGSSADRQPAAEEREEEQRAAEGADAAAASGDEPQDRGSPAPDIEAEWERRLEEQRKLADEHYQRFLRAQADFDNFRRRTRQEKEEFAKYASMKLIEQLLPVVDNFERALVTSKDNKDFDALLKGVEMIFRQLDQVLAQEGLQRIEAVGRPFNPEFHQAIMQVESEEHEEGIVVEEVQKGYMLKDKVLRPAMVKVSS